MEIINKCLKPGEFKEYVNKKFFGFLPANKIILHHTYSPTVKQWQGEKSILGLKNYYENKGWTSGPHLFIALDGIWLFTDMRKNGTHAGSGNWRSIGIEIVGDYQENKPIGLIWDYTLYAITTLNNKLGLELENTKFHRDFMATDCPGKAITKSWVIEELMNYKIFPDNTLIKEKTKKSVFFVKNNKKYPIPDWDTFLFFWGDRQDNIIVLSEEEINQIKTGGVLPSIKNLI